MDIVTETPYVVMPLDVSLAPSMLACTLLVKGTFKLQPEAPAAVAKSQQPLLGDETYLDDLGRSLRYASDQAPMKVRGEVTCNAVAHAGGRARTSLDVSLKVGSIHKTLRVHGDRAWSEDTSGRPILGRPLPFDTMPIRWERAFGGMAFPANPLGRGVEPAPDPSGKPVHYLANVEYQASAVAHPDDRPAPAGFGPVSPAWEPRATRRGTMDQRWALFRAPLPPLDFDPLHHQGAPDDQQIDGSFAGDEEIVLENLHRDIPVYRSALPGKRLRLFFVTRGSGPEPERFAEAPLPLDTVHIDAEKEELVLVWRRPLQIDKPVHIVFEYCYLAEESTASQPASVESHYARFKELRGAPEPTTAQEIDAEVSKGLAQTRQIARDGKMDPEVVRALEATDDPQKMFDVLMRYADEKLAELQKLTAGMKPPTS